MMTATEAPGAPPTVLPAESDQREAESKVVDEVVAEPDTARPDSSEYQGDGRVPGETATEIVPSDSPTAASPVSVRKRRTRTLPQTPQRRHVTFTVPDGAPGDTNQGPDQPSPDRVPDSPMTDGPEAKLALLEGLMFNPGEQLLSCCGMNLETIPDELAEVYGKKTQMLDLTQNNLSSLTGIERFTKLRELLLDSNRLGDDFTLPPMPSLTTLTLNKNRILDLKTLLAKLRVACPGLTFLSLIGNGACPNGLIYGTSAVEYSRYRQEVVTALPSILFLDSTPVSNADRPRGGPNREPPAGSKVSRESLRRELADSSNATLAFFDDGTLKKNPLRRISLFKHEVTSLALLADKWIVTSGSDGVLKVFDLSEGRWQHKCVAILKGHVTRVRSVACFADVRVVSASDDRTIRVWNLARQSCVRTLKGHQGPVRMVQTMKDGRIASCSDDGSVCVWETARNTPISMSGHIGPVNCVEVVSENLILSGGSDATIKFWDLADRSCLGSIMAHGGPVTSMVYIGTGQLASGSTDSTIKVWQLSDSTGAECVKTLRGHWNGITNVAQVEETTLIATGNDRLISQWDLRTGVCKTVLGGHGSSVNALVTRKTQDSIQVASCGESIKLWSLPAVDSNSGVDTEEDRETPCATAQTELIARFNDATEAGEVEAEGSTLWDVVVKVLSAIQQTADSIVSDEQEEDTHNGADKTVEPVYTTLTSAYPSTIGMFASPLSCVPTAADQHRAEDEERNLETGVALQDFTSKALHAFFSNEALSNPLVEINAKVQAWKNKMKRRRGPNMMDWLGAVNEKRTEEALERLVQLCDQTTGKRQTYLAIKNRLIEEFGEDVYSSIKDQLSVELAFRGLEGSSADAPAPPVKRDATPKQFFPETNRLITAHVSTQEDEEDALYAPPPPRVDVTTLYSVFDEIGEQCREEFGNEMQLAQQLEERLADLEAGEELNTIPFARDDDDLYAYIVENSRLLRATEEVSPEIVPPPEPEEQVAEEQEVSLSASPEAPINLVLQHEVWA